MQAGLSLFFATLPASLLLIFMKHISIRACVAEFLGTFMLATGVLACINLEHIGIPLNVIGGLILGTLVYTIGTISGAHINPAVTLSLFSIQKIKGRQAFAHIVSQVLAGILAFVIQKNFFPFNIELYPIDYFAVAMSEIVGTFILVWGICSVVYGKTEAAAGGLVIGTSLALGSLLAIGSLGILNPAVAIGFGIDSPVYLIAPLVGGFIAAQLYRWMINAK
jgi:glycerol uptake facilitator-like aquaporin